MKKYFISAFGCAILGFVIGAASFSNVDTCRPEVVRSVLPTEKMCEAREKISQDQAYFDERDRQLGEKFGAVIPQTAAPEIVYVTPSCPTCDCSIDFEEGKLEGAREAREQDGMYKVDETPEPECKGLCAIPRIPRR